MLPGGPRRELPSTPQARPAPPKGILRLRFLRFAHEHFAQDDKLQKIGDALLTALQN